MLKTFKDNGPLPEDFNKRKGFFRVSKELLDSSLDEVSYLLKFMGNFIVVRAEFMYHEDAISYYAVSSLFDPIEDGEKIPEYTFEIKKKADGDLIVTAKREQSGKVLLRQLRRIRI